MSTWKDSTEDYDAWEMIDNLQPKQNPMEAERWLKQAESDLKAMNYLKEALPLYLVKYCF